MAPIQTELTNSAKGYITSYFKGESFPEGFSYRTELNACSLDFSLDSLKRIDTLIDQIREKEKPQFEAFMEKQANQHFLHLVAFYAGYVAGKSIGMEPVWYNHEEAIAKVPQLKQLWPDEDLFETSVICMFHPQGLASLQYPPLLSLVARLFQGDKSIFASASGIKFTFEKNNKKPEPPVEGWFKKFRRILNSL